MTIGLSVKQIRKLGKSAYSDKQIINTAPGARGEIRRSGKLWWSNGMIVLFEPAPDAPEKRTSATDKVNDAKAVGKWVAACTVQVFPVEVIPTSDMRVILFENAKGDRVAVSAKYIGALLATRRVGKGEVRWYTDNDPTMPALLAVNGRRIGLVASMQVDLETEPEWNFRYTGELPC